MTMNVEEFVPDIEPKETIGHLILWLLTAAIVPILPAIRRHLSPSLQSLIPANSAGSIAIIVLLMIPTFVYVRRRWSNRRKHVWGKVRSGTKAIWIAEIQGDISDTQRTNIIDSLRENLQEKVDVLRAGIELKLEISGNANDDYFQPHVAAQNLLHEHRGDLVVWGKVVSMAEGVVLHLYFSAEALGEPLNRRVELDRLQHMKGLSDALAAVCVAMAVNPAAFLRRLENEPAPQEPLQLFVQVAQGVGWWTNEAMKNIAWLGTQAVQLSGQIGQTSVTSLNQAAVAAWSLLGESA